MKTKARFARLLANPERLQTQRRQHARLALLESTGTGRGRRHPVLVRTAMQELLLSKKERHNVRFAQRDPTAKMPLQLRLALLESTGTERD